MLSIRRSDDDVTVSVPLIEKAAYIWIRRAASELPIYDCNTSIVLQKNEYATLGKIVAVSIVQGRPGLPCLDKEVFRYIAGDHVTSIRADVQHIPDAEVFQLA